MSLYGLSNWRPYIDDQGVVHPTRAEQRKMLYEAQRQYLIAHIIGIGGCIALFCACLGFFFAVF
jgi:hypothetical protein